MSTPNDVLHISIMRADELNDTQRKDILDLCNRAYNEDLDALMETFDNPTHVLGYCDGKLVSHAMWVTRTLQVGALPPMRTAYVEAVATDPAYQRRGFAGALMQRLAAEIQDFDLGGLSPFSEAYYARFGWELWRGPLFVRTEHGLLASPPDEHVMILRLPNTPANLDVTQPLSAEWREGEVW